MQAAALAGGGVQASASALALGVFRAEGARGLFRGWAPLVARDVPLQAVFFSSYTVHSAWMQGVHDLSFGEGPSGRPPAAGPGAAVPSWRAYLAGGAAGSTAWAVIFPLDVVKTRMQVDKLLHAEPAAGTPGRHGMIHTARLIFREGGVRAFYRGVWPAILRAFPANAALFWGVELTTYALG
jgi:hypothetical protein